MLPIRSRAILVSLLVALALPAAVAAAPTRHALRPNAHDERTVTTPGRRSAERSKLVRISGLGPARLSDLSGRR